MRVITELNGTESLTEEFQFFTQFDTKLDMLLEALGFSKAEFFDFILPETEAFVERNSEIFGLSVIRCMDGVKSCTLENILSYRAKDLIFPAHIINIPNSLSTSKASTYIQSYLDFLLENDDDDEKLFYVKVGEESLLVFDSIPLRIFLIPDKITKRLLKNNDKKFINAGGCIENDASLLVESVQMGVDPLLVTYQFAKSWHKKNKDISHG